MANPRDQLRLLAGKALQYYVPVRANVFVEFVEVVYKPLPDQDSRRVLAFGYLTLTIDQRCVRGLYGAIMPPEKVPYSYSQSSYSY